MSVLALPFAIAGVLAALVPVAIHLLWRQRRRPVPWAAMRFLQQAWKRHRRRHRVEQLLLLAARALVLLLFGLALARPILGGAGGGAGGGDLWLVIDDSVTSGVRVVAGETGAASGDADTALDRARAEAVSAIDALGPGSRVGVITLARPAAAVLQPPTADLDAAKRLVERLEAKPVPADVAGAMLLAGARLSDEDGRGRPATVRLLSGLRRGTADLDAPLPRMPITTDRPVTLVASPPATTSPGNVTVVEVVPGRPVEVAGEGLGGGRVSVRLERTGDLDAARTRVELDGRFARPVAPQEVAWRSGQSEATAEFAVAFEPGLDLAVDVVARVDEDVLPAGDARATVIEVRTGLSVLLVDRRRFTSGDLERLPVSAWVERALRPVTDAPIEVRTVDPASLEPVDLVSADATIVCRPDLLDASRWSQLREHVDDGGLVVLLPPADVPVQRWTDRLSDLGLPWTVEREVRDVDPATGGLALDPEAPAPPLLAQVAAELPDLVRPVVAFRRLVIDPGPATGGTSVLPFVDGTPMLVAAAPGRAADGETATDADVADGLVVMLAVAPRLDWTNLPGKPLMVPLLQEIVRQGAGLVRTPGGVPAGERPRIAHPRSADRLVDPTGRIVALDRERRPVEPLLAVGTWTMLDAGDREVGRLAVHVEAEATRVDANPIESVRTWLAGAGPWTIAGEGGAGAEGTERAAGSGAGTIARWLLVAVLVLLVLETIMARRFSHAAPVRTAAQATRAGRRPPVRATLEERGPDGMALGGAGAAPAGRGRRRA